MKITKYFKYKISELPRDYYYFHEAIVSGKDLIVRTGGEKYSPEKIQQKFSKKFFVTPKSFIRPMLVVWDNPHFYIFVNSDCHQFIPYEKKLIDWYMEDISLELDVYLNASSL